MVFVSKFNDQQIAAVLDEYEAGASREELCARIGVTARTFFRWRANRGRSKPALRVRLTALEEENLRLKALLGALRPDALSAAPQLGGESGGA